MKQVLTVSICVLLVSCAAPTAESVKSGNTLNLCERYGYYFRKGDFQSVAVIEAELTRRGNADYIPDEQEKNLIRTENVAIGMHMCTLMAAMSLGAREYRMNYTQTANGTRAQFVIPPYGFDRRGYYVYVDVPPGRVVSIQNY
jgi:hypothetical protein